MLACTAVVGIAVALEQSMTDHPGPALPVLWWVAYGLFLVCLTLTTGLVPRPSAVPETALLSALVGIAIVTFSLFPVQGWTAILFVVTAAIAARLVSPRLAVAVVAVQTAVLAVGIAFGGWPFTDVVLGVVAYGGFQAFGALMVLAARRETEARHELAATHAELRSAMAVLEATSRDSERLRIARDLHDVVGHQLTALALELEVASHSEDPAVHVRRAREIAKGLLGDVRSTVGQMRDRAQPLEPSLMALARDVPGLTVSVTVAGADEIGGEETGVILRCAQEAITNTLRHAGADRLDLLVDAGPEGVRLLASDDGRGVERVEPGHGLNGMRERVESLGGSLVVHTSPGSGFRLVCELPGTRRTSA